MAQLPPGSIALVRYVEQELWHERLVLAWVENSDFVIATPDMDVYIEQLDMANPDLDAIRFPGPGEAPIGIARNMIYGFVPRLDPGGVAALIAEGDQISRLERAQRGLPALGPPAPGAAAPHEGGYAAIQAAPVVPVVAPAPAQAAAGFPGAPGVPAPQGGPAVVLPLAAFPAQPRVVPPAGMWVLDEPMPQRAIGEPVAFPPGAVNVGGRALVSLDGIIVAIRFLTGGTDIDRYVAARRDMLADDVRTLAMPSEGDQRSFVETCRSMVFEPSYVIKLSGPRTASPYIDRVIESGVGGMMARHERWARESGVPYGDKILYERQVICRALELAALRDGLNLRNLNFAELLFRRLQLQEEAVAENPTAPSFDGAEHYLGTEDSKGGMLVVPSLKQHVAARMAEEAAILKEKRKAREARRGPDEGGGGGSGRGGGGGGGGGRGGGRGSGQAK